MLQQALQKLNAEVGAEKKNKYVPVIGGFLVNHIRNNPEDAAKIMTEGKTIAGSINAMRDEASKNQGMISDEDGLNVVLKYYGVPVEEPVPIAVSKVANFDISLEDLM